MPGQKTRCFTLFVSFICTRGLLKLDQRLELAATIHDDSPLGKKVSPLFIGGKSLRVLLAGSGIPNPASSLLPYRPRSYAHLLGDLCCLRSFAPHC